MATSRSSAVNSMATWAAQTPNTECNCKYMPSWKGMKFVPVAATKRKVKCAVWCSISNSAV